MALGSVTDAGAVGRQSLQTLIEDFNRRTNDKDTTPPETPRPVQSAQGTESVNGQVFDPVSGRLDIFL